MQAPPGQGSRYRRVFRFVTHYWLMFPGLFGVLLTARIASTLVDVSVPVASGLVVDALAAGSRHDPGPSGARLRSSSALARCSPSPANS
jgi:hypothetical protein